MSLFILNKISWLALESQNRVRSQLTSKYFEIFCADTIPLVMLDPDHAELIYGPGGRQLALYNGIPEKLLEVLNEPEKYRDIVNRVRSHLCAHHSFTHRLQELVAALEG